MSVSELRSGFGVIMGSVWGSSMSGSVERSSSMSCAEVTSVAPSRMRWLHPAADGLSMGPGTA